MEDEIVYHLATVTRQQDTIRCKENGCDRSAILKCFLPDDNEDEGVWYCWEHAVENGFCGGSGCFIAGWIEDRDYCDNCWDEITANERDEDDDD